MGQLEFDESLGKELEVVYRTAPRGRILQTHTPRWHVGLQDPTPGLDSDTWKVDAAWTGVLAGDIDDLHEHLELERDSRG